MENFKARGKLDRKAYEIPKPKNSTQISRNKNLVFPLVFNLETKSTFVRTFGYYKKLKKNKNIVLAFYLFVLNIFILIFSKIFIILISEPTLRILKNMVLNICFYVSTISQKSEITKIPKKCKIFQRPHTDS